MVNEVESRLIVMPLLKPLGVSNATAFIISENYKIETTNYEKLDYHKLITTKKYKLGNNIL